MISLIAADMDGTLLDAGGNIPARFNEVFRRLEAENILFAVASGRQYYNLVEHFCDIQNKIVFIAENGTFVVYQGKTLYLSPIPKADVMELCRYGRNISHSDIVVCGRKSAYIERRDGFDRSKFLVEFNKYYAKLEVINSFEEINDDILKFAFCTFEGAEKVASPAFLPFADRFSLVISGSIWMDITMPNTNKGVALMHVQKYFGISRDQTMAFGDFLNDVELLKNAKYSYAMANAHPGLFEYASFKAGANDEDGVMRQIVHMLDYPKEYEPGFTEPAGDSDQKEK
jgi:Cof subfamily protein (haloacid dehalogenase superfamily)